MEDHDHDYLTDQYQCQYDYWREQEADAQQNLDDNWGQPGDCLNCGGKNYACFCGELE